MKLTVTGRHVDVTDAQRNSIQRKTTKLRRVLGRAALSAQAVIAKERQLTVCDLTIHASGDHALHGRGRDKNFNAAVTAAIERVYRQAVTLADRWKSRRKGDGA